MKNPKRSGVSGYTGDVRYATSDGQNGDVTAINKSKHSTQGASGLTGNVEFPPEILSNGKLVGAKRSVEEAANAHDLVDLGLLTDGYITTTAIPTAWCDQHQA